MKYVECKYQRNEINLATGRTGGKGSWNVYVQIFRFTRVERGNTIGRYIDRRMCERTGNTGVLIVVSATRKETSSEACQGRAQFQQHRDSNCHQVVFPARQSAEGNSRHSDRNISLFFYVWLTVHRSSVWITRPTRCHLVLYLFLLYRFLNMFRATLCPSSGADDLLVFVRCVAEPWLCRQSDPVGC